MVGVDESCATCILQARRCRMAFKLAGAGMSFAAADPNSGLEQTSEAERQDQQRALSSLLGVLLAAGYFRARIPTLKPFDKVVGGLCWAISSSGAAVDVDLFYDEELALGQKMCVMNA